MLVVQVQNIEDGVLLRCIGRIVAGEEVERLRSVARAYRDQKEIVLDLANVSTLDGAGIGALALLEAQARDGGSRLIIQNPSDRVRQLLELTNLDSVIEITPSREFQEICDTIRHSCSLPLQYAAAR